MSELRGFIRTAAAVIIAVLVYTLFAKISPEFAFVLNVFNLTVLYFALQGGEITGACMGTVCGLIQDSFSIGVFGIAGISKTLMGFLAGYIPRKINTVPFVRRLVFFLILLVAELSMWMFLYSFVLSEKFYSANGLYFLEPICTALLALAVFPLIRKLKKALSR